VIGLREGRDGGVRLVDGQEIDVRYFTHTTRRTRQDQRDAQLLPSSISINVLGIPLFLFVLTRAPLGFHLG
jgi:hypothetical protein